MADDVYSNAEIAKYETILAILPEDRCVYFLLSIYAI